MTTTLKPSDSTAGIIAFVEAQLAALRALDRSRGPRARREYERAMRRAREILDLDRRRN